MDQLEKMEHLDSSRDHLETWDNLTKMFIWGSIGVAAILLIMAATLV